MKRLGVGVVGCGHLGAIHARLLAARPDAHLVAVVDPDPDSRGRAAQQHGCAALADPRELVGRVDAAIVAAPTGLHASVSLPLLEGGVDLLVEKPLAATVEEARAIVVAARRQGRVVAVGHVERFNPAWRLAVEQAGRITAVESARLAPFTFRSMDVGVVLDLMIHDIDLVLALEPGRLERVEARGIVATGGHEDAVRARLVFSGGLIADLAASRIHPTVRRSVSLWSNQSVVTVDFNAKTVEVISPSDSVRGGTFVAADVPAADRATLKDSFFTDVLPRRTLPVPEANAIACEHDDFLAAVRERRQPTVPAAAGAAALEIAARLLDTMACHRFGAADGTVGPALLPGLRGPLGTVLRPELRRKTG